MAIKTKTVTLGLFVLLGGTWLGCNPQATNPKDDPVCIKEHKARKTQQESGKAQIKATQEQCEKLVQSLPAADQDAKQKECQERAKEASTKMEWDEVCLSVECGLRVSTDTALKQAAGPHLSACRENGFLAQQSGDSNAGLYMEFVTKCLGDDALKTPAQKDACMFAVLTKLTATAHPPAPAKK